MQAPGTPVREPPSTLVGRSTRSDDPMLLTTLTLTLLLASPAAQQREIHWETRLDRGMNRARETGKPLMVGFYTEWCGLCRRLDRTTYVEPQVVARADRFVTVKIDADGGDRARRVLRRYRVDKLPTILFLTPGGLQVRRVNSFIGPGLLPIVMDEALEASRHVTAWESRLARDENDAAALAAIGAHLFKQERYPESADYLKRAAARDTGRPLGERRATRLNLAKLSTARGRFAEAEGLIQEALSLHPDDRDHPLLLFVLAKTYVVWGRTDMGVATMRVIVRDYPGSPVALKARETLVSLKKE